MFSDPNPNQQNSLQAYRFGVISLFRNFGVIYLFRNFGVISLSRNFGVIS